MSWVDTTALYIGYAVMATGGVLLACGLFWLAVEAVWRLWRASWNAADIFEATAEWRHNHPDRFATWKKRNDVE